MFLHTPCEGEAIHLALDKFQGGEVTALEMQRKGVLGLAPAHMLKNPIGGHPRKSKCLLTAIKGGSWGPLPLKFFSLELTKTADYSAIYSREKTLLGFLGLPLPFNNWLKPW